MPALYQYLNAEIKEIRLLQIDSAPSDSQLQCRLLHASLSDSHAPCPSFAALSYVWGDPSLAEEVIINGTPLRVTASLAGALRHAKQLWASSHPDDEADDFYLWADAICIDQSDVGDKNYQVPLMSVIYGAADMVFAWLGTGKEFNNVALESIAFIASERRRMSEQEYWSLEWMRQHPDWYEHQPNIGGYPPNRRWQSIMRMLGEPLWFRVWIYQEMALAKKLLICAPGRVLHFDDMVTLLDLIDGASSGAIPCPAFLHNSFIWELLENANFDGFVQASIINAGRLIVQYSGGADYSVAARKGQAWQLSDLGRRRQATDPRDHVYGLTSISQIGVEVDYRKRVGEVYRDYVEAMLRQYQLDATNMNPHELHFLHYAGIGVYENAHNLPSWAPNFPEDSVRNVGGRYIDGHADLDAFPSGQPAEIRDLSLFVDGIMVDAIEYVEVLSENFLRDGSFLRYAQQMVAKKSTYGAGIPTLQAMFWALRLDAKDVVDESFVIFCFNLLLFLVLHNSNDDIGVMDAHLASLGIAPLDVENDGSDFDKSFAQTLGYGYEGPPRKWRDLFLNSDELHDLQFASMEVELSGRWGLFESSSGYLGLVPLSAAGGDAIFVLKGSGLPLALRNRGTHYVNIGTCFIPGLMAGEVSGIVKNDHTVIRRIELR